MVDLLDTGFSSFNLSLRKNTTAGFSSNNCFCKFANVSSIFYYARRKVKELMAFLNKN